jgi:hypothetical protein
MIFISAKQQGSGLRGGFAEEQHMGSFGRGAEAIYIM